MAFHASEQHLLPMNSRERMICAFRNQQPDMVPVAPDISNMVPARMTGRPFWDVYLHGTPPLNDAYIAAVRYFGFDGWSDKGHLQGPYPNVEFRNEVIEETSERIVRKTIASTPAGAISQAAMFTRGNPPALCERWIKDIRKDIACAKYLFPDPSKWSDAPYQEARNSMAKSGTTGLCVGIPGMQTFCEMFEGGVEAATFCYFDNRHELMELVEVMHEHAVRYIERGLLARPDFVLIGASGLLTMQSPQLFRELSLPTIQEITRMTRAAGVPSHLHSCGRQRLLVEICANETELDSIEPLETAPMGDCILAEIKQRFGRRIALKGNLHTTNVMLNGSPTDVRRESLRAIRDAGEGGGFVLATGDQCGRDTPDANLFAMVEAAREFGRYPLDMDAIEREIERLSLFCR